MYSVTRHLKALTAGGGIHECNVYSFRLRDREHGDGEQSSAVQIRRKQKRPQVFIFNQVRVYYLCELGKPYNIQL